MKKFVFLSFLMFVFLQGALFSQEKSLDNGSAKTPVEKLQELEANQPPDRFFYELWNMLATLGLVVAVLLALSWLLKKMLNTRVQQINETSGIKILEHRSLSTKTSVYLLEIHGRAFVLAESQNGVTALDKVKEWEPMKSEEWQQ